MNRVKDILLYPQGRNLAALLEMKGVFNNLNLLRFVSAWLVIFSHVTTIIGVQGNDPITDFCIKYGLGLTAGQLALNLFFFISGFLVSRSWFRKHDPFDFVVSRVLRIWPALVVCNLVTLVFVAIVFREQFLAIWARHDFQHYFSSNSSLLSGLRLDMFEGTFEGNPYRYLNGALWTLPIEVHSYLLIGLIGLTTVFRSRLLSLLAIGGMLGVVWFQLRIPLYSAYIRTGPWITDFLMLFWVGVLYARFSDRWPANRLMYSAALLSGVLFFIWPAQRYLFYFFFAQLIFFLAYETPYLKINKHTEMSYGIFLYGFPCQQFLQYFFPMLGFWGNFLAAGAICTGIGALSWTYIEAPSMRLRKVIHLRELRYLLQHGVKNLRKGRF